MKELRYTLLTDGSSDAVLLPILTWLLRAQQVQGAIQPQWADLRRLSRPPRELSNELRLSVELYPCDLLFVHRDAEAQTREARVAEIQRAWNKVGRGLSPLPVICVVPVRMTEAWLLFDEMALRLAAGNPQGRQQLLLPTLAQVEQLPDPKSLLHELLREASGLSGRRRRHFNVGLATRRLAEFMHDFAPLHNLTAFQALEAEVKQIVQNEKWD